MGGHVPSLEKVGPAPRVPAPLNQARREGREVFLGPTTFVGPPSLKNTLKAVPYDFFLTSDMHKIQFRPGGTYDAPSDPLPILPLLDACVSISEPTE